MTCAVAHYKPRLPGAEWMADCVLHWSEDFQGSQRRDKLGQHKETDILSGPSTAIVILWWCQGVRSRKVQMERKCLRFTGGENATWHFSKWKVNCLCWAELLPPRSITNTVNINVIEIDYIVVKLLNSVNVANCLSSNWRAAAAELDLLLRTCDDFVAKGATLKSQSLNQTSFL